MAYPAAKTAKSIKQDSNLTFHLTPKKTKNITFLLSVVTNVGGIKL